MPSLPTILVVDDQPELLIGIQMALEASNYRVLTASDGHIALRLLEQDSVDLILADIAMPEMNGYQLYEQVRTEARWVRIPFIFLTARAMPSDVRYGKMLGADDYLIKPVKPEDLCAAVEGRLRRARELAALADPSQGKPSDNTSLHLAESNDLLVVGTLRIAPEQYRAWLGDHELNLTAREFKVLEYLARQNGNVLSPHDLVLVSHGIKIDNLEAGALVRPLIRSLRRTMGYAIGEYGCIENVRGVGYRLVPPT